MTPQELLCDFDFLPEWEDKYRYIIELGEKLPPLPESEKSIQNKIEGCASQVFMTAHQKDGKYYFTGDSDA
ncbi:MAG: SufE family protein, partial [Lactobacillales bacterium]|nr:SufE family protein [Lactobacillales bacterium]